MTLRDIYSEIEGQEINNDNFKCSPVFSIINAHLHVQNIKILALLGVAGIVANPLGFRPESELANDVVLFWEKTRYSVDKKI